MIIRIFMRFLMNLIKVLVENWCLSLLIKEIFESLGLICLVVMMVLFWINMLKIVLISIKLNIGMIVVEMCRIKF